MRHDDGYEETFTGSRAAGPGGGAASPAAGGEHSPSGAGGGERPGLGGLWLLLAPLACCGGPFLIAALAAAGALAWGGLGLGIAALVAVAAVVLARRRRRSQVCREPATGWQAEAAVRRPAAR